MGRPEPPEKPRMCGAFATSRQFQHRRRDEVPAYIFYKENPASTVVNGRGATEEKEGYGRPVPRGLYLRRESTPVMARTGRKALGDVVEAVTSKPHHGKRCHHRYDSTNVGAKPRLILFFLFNDIANLLDDFKVEKVRRFVIRVGVDTIKL